MTGARLDRLYISKSDINRVTILNIYQMGFQTIIWVPLDYNVAEKTSRPTFYLAFM